MGLIKTLGIVAAILMAIAWVNPHYADNKLTFTFNWMCGSFFFLILIFVVFPGG